MRNSYVIPVNYDANIKQSIILCKLYKAFCEIFVNFFLYTTIKERLVKFAKSKERSVRAFEREAGLTIGYVNTIRVSVQPDKLQRIASRYPDLNTEWLMTGVGPMTRGGSVKTSTATNKAETPNVFTCLLYTSPSPRD